MPGLPDRFCCDEDLERIGYDGHGWRRDLEQLRRDGPRPTTLELIDVLRAEGVEGATIREIGAGVGVVHLALLEAGAARAVDVDASREYLAAAREEAERRGLAGASNIGTATRSSWPPSCPRPTSSPPTRSCAATRTWTGSCARWPDGSPGWSA